MSNRYHLVLFVNQLHAQSLTQQEVVQRWTQMFGTPLLISRLMSGQLEEGERDVAERIIEIGRDRLCDISMFMKCLNEHLARRANAEDNKTGKFWAGSLLHAAPAFATSM